MSSSLDRRQAATEHYAQAAAAINDVFDRADDLRTTAADIVAHVSKGDPVLGAIAMLNTLGQLEVALERLRSAAVLAATFRTKRDLASDIGTRVGLLFPRDLGDGCERPPTLPNSPQDVRRNDDRDA